MAPASLPRTRSERQDAKSLRPHLPSIVEIIDHREPDYSQLAEFNLPTRSKVTGRTREVGIGDRSGFRHFPGRSLFVYIRSLLEEMREKNRKVSCGTSRDVIGAERVQFPPLVASGNAPQIDAEMVKSDDTAPRKELKTCSLISVVPESAGIHVYPSVPSLIRNRQERES